MTCSYFHSSFIIVSHLESSHINHLYIIIGLFSFVFYHCVSKFHIYPLYLRHWSYFYKSTVTSRWSRSSNSDETTVQHLLFYLSLCGNAFFERQKLKLTNCSRKNRKSSFFHYSVKIFFWGGTKRDPVRMIYIYIVRHMSISTLSFSLCMHNSYLVLFTPPPSVPLYER